MGGSVKGLYLERGELVSGVKVCNKSNVEEDNEDPPGNVPF